MATSKRTRRQHSATLQEEFEVMAKHSHTHCGPHSAGAEGWRIGATFGRVQHFFKQEVRSRGWYTAELRKFAVRFRRSILRERGMDFLVHVADELFSGKILEEKIMGVFLLEDQTESLGDREFQLFTSWIDRISSWSDHDSLVHCLLSPMVAAKASRSREVFAWAKSPNRWRRRAACVALIRGARERHFRPQILRLANQLLHDQDDMVQKAWAGCCEKQRRPTAMVRSVSDED